MKSVQYINYPGEWTTSLYEIIQLNPSLLLIIWRIFTMVLFLGLAWISYKRITGKNELNNTTFLSTPTSFLVIAALALFLLRIPNLVLKEMQVDESLFIRLIDKMLNGGIVWKDMSTGTGGPLNFILPGLFYWLGDGVNYMLLRVFGLIICVIPTILLIFQIFKRLFDYYTAILLTIPLMLLFSFADTNDMIAYNCEHFAFLLISLGMLILISISKSKSIDYSQIIAMGLIIGLSPFAKIQSIPIFFAIGCCLLFELFTQISPLQVKLKKLGILTISFLVPLAIMSIYMISNNAFEYFVDDYILNNIRYTQSGNGATTHGVEKLFILPILMYHFHDTRLFYGITGLALIFSIVLLISRKQIKQLFSQRITIYLLSILFFSYLAVIIPGNHFAHYHLFFLIPFTLTCGWIIGNLMIVSDKRTLIGYILLVVALPLFYSIYKGNRGIFFVKDKKKYELEPVSKEIKKLTSSGDLIEIWGWADKYYVEAERGKASRGVHPYDELLNGKNNPIDLREYVKELELKKPSLFIDAVNPLAFVYYDRKVHGYEAFVPVKEFINTHYKFVNEIEGIRIYALK